MKLEKFIRKIESSNEAFNNMNNAEKRVQIAKDCIQRIRLRLLEPITGLLISKFEELDCELKQVVNSVECEACAKGGLFLSYVGRVNKFKVSDLDYYDCSNTSNQIEKIKEIFTQKQLALIELAFEGVAIVHYVKGYDSEWELKDSYPYKKYRACMDFHYKNPHSIHRMIAICENIIENKGTFKP